MQARQLTIEDYIIAINALEAEIAQPESVASDKRWEQAEQVWGALQQPGMTQERLAREWKRPSWQGGGPYSQRHVAYVKATWETFQHLGSKPPWNEAYHSPEVRKHQHHGNGATPPILARTPL